MTGGILAAAVRNLRDLGQLFAETSPPPPRAEAPVSPPPAKREPRLHVARTILVAGHEVPYERYVACDFTVPGRGTLVEQLGLAVAP